MDHYPALCIIEIEGVQKAVKRYGDRFLKRLFSGRELAYCMPRAARHQHLACRLAVKFAVRRALRDAGLKPPPSGSIEVSRDEWGKPSVALAGGPSSVTLLLSLSHSRRYAAASVILVCGSPPRGPFQPRRGRPQHD